MRQGSRRGDSPALEKAYTGRRGAGEIRTAEPKLQILRAHTTVENRQTRGESGACRESKAGRDCQSHGRYF